MSSSSLMRGLALVPGGYFLLTRVSGARDALYLVGTSFVPAWWYLARSTELDPVTALGSFAIGYLAFIASYELGYLANDLWDARRDPGGRQRAPFLTGTLSKVAFVAIRLLTWLLVASVTGWSSNSSWLAGFAALAVVFALHNVVPAWARSATFMQLAVLRFSLPVMGPLPASAAPLLLLLALLLYASMRWLAYLDSKGMLTMEARRTPSFGAVQMALQAPVIGLIALLAGSTLPLELWGWFFFLYGAWALKASRSRRRSE